MGSELDDCICYDRTIRENLPCPVHNKPPPRRPQTELEMLRAENARLREALKRAVDVIEQNAPGMEKTLRRLRDALEGKGT
jgi:hypothetical protein